jgi:uncharacterized membrane protein YphA (DoxX/SURF4 family)
MGDQRGETANTVNLLKRAAANGYLTLALRIIVGATLIVAGVAKAPHQWELVDLIKGYGILPAAFSQAYGLLLPWGEIAAGVCLILGLFTRYASALSILMFASFTVANSVSLARGATYCSECFGKLTELLSWQALLLDIVFLAMSLQILLQDKEFLSADSLLTKRAVALPKRNRS